MKSLDTFKEEGRDLTSVKLVIFRFAIIIVVTKPGVFVVTKTDILSQSMIFSENPYRSGFNA